MYEPIIDPMIFYLIELVEKLQLAPIFVLFMGVLLGNLVEPTKVTIQCPCGYTLKTKDITGGKLCGGTSK